jgi:hypothetical protein
MRLRKYVKNPELIECPFCGCKPVDGFDCVDHEDIGGDSYCRDVYECQVCKKKSVRCYEFYSWEDMDGNDLYAR